MNLQRTSPKLFLTGLFLIALLIRLIYMAEYSQNPMFDYIGTGLDHSNFDIGAQNFARGDWLADAPNNSYAPLYKYFLGVIYWLFGRNFWVVYSIQFIMGSLAGVLIFLIGRKLFGTRAGIFSFLGFALYVPEIIYEGIILRAAFIAFWGIVSFYLLLRLRERCDTLGIVLATLALSLFFQGRPNTLLCLPVVCIYFYKYVFTNADSRLKSWTIFFGTLGLSFLPLLIQCYVTHGKFVLFDASGPHTFISGNIIDYPGVGWEPDLVDKFEKENELAYSGVTGFLFRHIWENPWEFCQLYLRKLYFLLNDFQGPSNLSIYLFAEFSKVLKTIGLHFAWVSSFALVGCVWALKQRRDVFLLAGFLASLSVAVLMFLNESRYQIPLVPYFILFAGYGLDRIVESIRQKRFRVSAVTLGVILLCVYAFQVPGGILYARQIDHCNMAKAYLGNPRRFNLEQAERYTLQCWEIERKGDLAHPYSKHMLASIYVHYAGFQFQNKNYSESLRSAESALELNPYHLQAHKLVALSHFNQKHVDRAIRSALTGLALAPSDQDFYRFLANFFHSSNHRHVEEYLALKGMRRLESRPDRLPGIDLEMRRLKAGWEKPRSDFEQNLHTARNFFNQGLWQKALPVYLKINRDNVSDANLYFQLGSVLGILERFDSALDALYKGLMLDPDHRGIHRMLGEYYLTQKMFVPARIHLQRIPGREKNLQQIEWHLGSQERPKILPAIDKDLNRQLWEFYQNSQRGQKAE